jgi:hypothetical protein
MDGVIMAYIPQTLTAAQGGTGVKNSSTITLGGAISTANSFTTSGNFALTLTQTGATNVTLPTSGTLATTAQVPSTPISIANGGTNATSMGTSTGIVKYDGTSLVTSSTAKIDSSNRYTNTSQPAFLAYLTTSVNDVTGDATVYQIIFDTESFDIGNNFNLSTSVFTAPVTGIYHFDFGVLLGGGTVMSLVFLRITTTALTFQRSISTNGGTTGSASGTQTILCQMSANDTATFSVAATDTGGKVDDVNGISGGLIRTWAAGWLVT